MTSRTIRRVAPLFALCLTVAVVALRPRVSSAQPMNQDKALIQHLIDSLHDAASRADGKAYFALFADEAIFLGTDASERWTIADFKTYAQARFDKGQGWTYTPTYRSVYVSPDRTVAWFDELLSNEKYGVCRGSGVLTNNGAAWLITQYNLSVPIPNDLLPKVATMIRDDADAKLKAIEAEGQKRQQENMGGGMPQGNPPPKKP